MIDRRRLMTAAAALAAAPAATARSAALGRSVLDHIFLERMKASPETMTSLGLDRGDGAWAASKLDDPTRAADVAMTARRRGWIRELKTLPPGLDRDVLLYAFESVQPFTERFTWGLVAGGYPTPYVLSQLSGVYWHVPELLETRHRIETATDAEAWLARLDAFAGVLDQETERARADAAQGVVPPDFVIDRTLEQLRTLRGDRRLARTLAAKTRAAGLAGDWQARAEAILARRVEPALDRQIALVEGWRAGASHEAGCWRLPRGDDWYALALRQQTTTNMGVEEVHELGLDLCRRLSERADTLLRGEGLTQGSAGARINSLFTDRRQRFPNSDSGRAGLLGYLEGIVADMDRRLPDYFGTLPKTRLVVERIPPAAEAGSPAGHYIAGSLDGSRPGAYAINLRDTAEVPRWMIVTLTWHEGSPGHHLQRTLANEAGDLHPLRKITQFGAYQEGWALYAEELAKEMGVYEDDPFGEVGYLQGALLRATRLVVDTGMHHYRWSREKALAFYMDTVGDPEPAAVTEIERYAIWPGQACSYMIGKETILRLREEAKARLGQRFDIRRFHDTVLLNGSVPLEVLERVVRAA